MHFKFAEVDPLSYGCEQTEEEREQIITKMTPSSFSETVDRSSRSGVLVIMKGPADDAKTSPFSLKSAIEWFKNLLEDHHVVLMRRRLVGYEWRIYLINKPDVLLYATTAEEYREATKNGYEAYVVSMGTRLVGGHALSRPIQRTFPDYVDVAMRAKRGWDSYMEKQSAPTPAN